MTEERKTFYLNKDKEKPITAGGLILYRFVKGNLELLLAESRGVYEDLGGRADMDDKNIRSTVAREASEESNEQLDLNFIKKRLRDITPIYNRYPKYVVYILEASKEESKLKSSDFGNREKHDDIPRKIKWIPIDTFMKPEILQHKLNHRLKNTSLFNRLKSIKDDNKINSSMFF